MKKNRFKKCIIVIALIVPLLLLLFVYSSEGSSFSFEHAGEENPVDTDGDGYSDELEIANGYSPYNPDPVKFSESDMDGDRLSDYFEYVFGTDPFNADTDGDGYSDFVEIDNAYDPLNPEPVKLSVRVEINLGIQTMSFFVDGHHWREFPISTGKPSMPTRVGEYKVVNKIKKAWSKTYGLYMPFWLGLDRGNIGIHELPIWPNGYREGSHHLGVPVSHGCIRLGIGAAEYVYNHLEVGDTIIVKP